MMTSMNEQGTGTLSMIGIVQAQQAQGIWFAFQFFPLGLIALFIFAVAMVAETNRAPFDLPEAESELTAGFHTEYSGFRWSIFFLAEYASMFAVSGIAVLLGAGVCVSTERHRDVRVDRSGGRRGRWRSVISPDCGVWK